MVEPTENTTINGRYAVLRELGRGGSAVVYVATDLKLGGLVAVKAMHAELSESRVAGRFRREIRLMADFGHANILPVIDSGEWDGRLFYVMKYVEGSESLRDRLLRQPGGLPINDVLEIARGVCSALSYAHARGVLHRDVKPENILLSGRHPYLTDFGVAKAMEPTPADTRTSSGYALGTQRYMSPEQEVADPHIDGRTDVWSLSCVMFEALTGLHPFNSPDASRMRAMKVADHPESLRRHRPSVPPWLEAAIERGLSPNPADRWQSIDEFARLLEQSGFHFVSDSAHAVFTSTSGHQFAAGANRAVPSHETRSNPLYHGALPGRTGWHARLPVLVIAVVVVAVASVAAWAGYRRTSASRDQTPREHVVAVSIVSLPADTALQQIAQRVNDAVTRELSRVPAFRVLSSTFMEECRQQAPAACVTILGEQGVDTRMHATLERHGDSIRALVELVDVRSRFTIPSPAVSARDLDDPGSRDRFAARLAIVFRQRLGAYRGRDVIALADADSEDRTLLGIIARERADADSLALFPGAAEQRVAFTALSRADSLFSRLLVRHRRSAALWIERGWVTLAMSQRAPDRRIELLQQAIAFADSALAIASDSAGALELRGHAKIALADALPNGEQESLDVECDAERDLERAVAGIESLYRSWNALSWLRWSAGRTHEAKLAVDHAMQHDAYFEKGRAGLINVFFAQLLLGNFPAAREVCVGGHDLWPSDYKFVECQLTLMMYDASLPPSRSAARQLVAEAIRLDSPEKARVMGNEFRTLYRELAAAIIATRAGDVTLGRAELARARARVDASGSTELRNDFSPMEAILVWELGDVDAAHAILAQWLQNRPDQAPNFRQDPLFQHMQVRDPVLQRAGLPLVALPWCGEKRAT